MATATASPKPRTFFSLFWRRLRRHKMAMASLVVIVLLVLFISTLFLFLINIFFTHIR